MKTTFLVITALLGGALAASPVFADPGHRQGSSSRRMENPPPRSSDPDEVQAAQLLSNAISGLGCERAGDALRRLSNMLLSQSRFAHQAPLPSDCPPGNPQRCRLREEMRQKWKNHLRSDRFWQHVWDRLANAYRSCNLTCFDDGVAVGQISGTGYCSASVAVGGLSSPGFISQPSLPLCQNSIFVGCQRGYRDAAAQFDGCRAYTDGLYATIFNQFISQDCHLDGA